MDQLPWLEILRFYLLGISLIAFAVTVYDKWAAKHRPRHRTPEKTLLWISAAGGSVAMLLTMLAIRHKTRHVKFMVGIPLILAAQIALAILLWWYI